MVSGCVAPWSRSRSARARLYSGKASFSRPAWCRAVARSEHALSVSGWSGPRTVDRSLSARCRMAIASGTRPAARQAVAVAAGGERGRMVGPEHPYPVGQGALVQQDRVFLATSGQAGTGQAGERGQRLAMVTAQSLLPFGQQLFLDANGVGRAARSHIGGGQAVAGRAGLGVTRAQEPAARGDHGLPVGNGRASQPGVVQALASAQQDRVGLGRPEQITGGPVQAGRAAAQGLHIKLVQIMLPARPAAGRWPPQPWSVP